MCGIVGVLDRTGDAVSSVAIRRMSDQIIHRGPDDSGILQTELLVWGTDDCRLSICQLPAISLWQRPMAAMSWFIMVRYITFRN